MWLITGYLSKPNSMLKHPIHASLVLGDTTTILDLQYLHNYIVIRMYLPIYSFDIEYNT